MDVFVAVLRLRGPEDAAVTRFHTPQDFDLLVGADGASNGLLRVRTRASESPVDCALRHVRRSNFGRAKRAVPVPLCVEKPTSSAASAVSPLVCVPFLESETKAAEKSNEFRFCNLAFLLNLAIKGDAWLEKESRYLIACLDDWLTHQQHSNVHFVSAVFHTPAAVQRLRQCAHNPGQNPRFTCFCYRLLGRPKATGAKRKSSELEEAVEFANTTRLFMLWKEKYDKFIMNQAYGGIVTRRMRAAAPEYFAKGRKSRRERRKSEAVPSASAWENQFPLHAAAYEGDHLRVKVLLNHGHDPNEPDQDGWTPLHYSCFYNRYEVAEELMLHRGIQVNATNRTGATALHFAALNGHPYLVELMLSHALIDTEIPDINGRTALELCERVPKPEWQRAALLLRDLKLRPEKIEVHLMGRSVLQVNCSLTTETAGDLRDKILKLEGLDPRASRVFAIWIVSDRLALQLKAEKPVQTNLEKWPELLEKFGDSPAANHTNAADVPHIVLKRDARTLLGDERDLARNSAAAVRLLYGEAEQNFLNGMLPCKEKDCLKMAAIIMRLLYGAKQTTAGPNILATVLPKHCIPPAGEKAHQRLVNRLLEAHAALPQTNVPQLQFDFLQCCWKLNMYGATFFKHTTMYRSKPPHETTAVYVGLNDWGVSVISRQTLKQIEAVELSNVDLHYTAGKNFVEMHRRKHDTLIFNTPQAMLINNLFTQLKSKVSTAAIKK